MHTVRWCKLPARPSEIQLDFVLACGQSFRWTKNALGEWVGVIGEHLFALRQNDDHVEYRVFPEPPMPDTISSEPLPKKRSRVGNAEKSASSETSTGIPDPHGPKLHHYLALDTALSPLYESWTACDERFAAIAPKFQGIRILQQDFVETLFSFICSSNNNIERIQQMVENLCVNYGSEICTVDGKTFYSFPPVNHLAGDDVEGELRKLGFGYRAAFIQKSAKYIIDHPDWLNAVKSADYATAKSLLMELPGVGAKVADCICLMSLAHHGAVPVDTHVFSVTRDYYLPQLRTVKSVTPRVYDEIGAFYRQRFGPMAGWAHSVLFTADLARFKEKKPVTVRSRAHKKTGRGTT